MTRTNKIILSAVVVVILLGLYIAYDKSKNKIALNTGTNQTVSTTTNGNIVTNANGNYTIEQVPVNESRGVPQPIPDLNRSVYQPSAAKVSPEAISLATSKILPLQATLKKNPATFDAWIDLGIYQKMAGDYEGTSISWQYASKLAPSDYISVGNLGNLYAYFIKDNAKAEMYYLLAIKNGPDQEYLYTQFAEFYRDFLHNNIKALNIVNQGLAKIPNDVNLLALKKSLSSN